MRKFLKILIFLIFVLLIGFVFIYYKENEINFKEPKLIEKLSKILILKAQKYNLPILESENYFWRAKKQALIQKNKIFFFRDFSYSNKLYQKSFDYAKNEIIKFKEKEKNDKENFLNKLKEIKNLNAQIIGIFNKVPLGSNFFQELLLSTLHLNETENYFKINRFDLAKKKLDLAYSETEGLFLKIENLLKDFYNPEKLKGWRLLYNEALKISFNLNTIVVIKDERILKVLKNGKVLKAYDVEFGKNPLEKKIKSGDLATPEGRYKIIEKKGRKQTKYYLALLLNYPNEEDKRRFEEYKRKGLIKKDAKIGGLIEIHGDGGKGIDWTEGCVALSNEDMKELFNLVSNGTPVYVIGSVGNNNVLSSFENYKQCKNSKKS